jgi:hypothetical protein
MDKIRNETEFEAASKLEVAVERVADEIQKRGAHSNTHGDWDLAAKIAEEVLDEPADKWTIMTIISLAGVTVLSRIPAESWFDPKVLRRHGLAA